MRRRGATKCLCRHSDWERNLERSDAEKLLRVALSLDAQFGALDAAVSRIPNEVERKALAKELGALVGKLNDAFIRPIVRPYPDLDPDTPQAKL